MSLDLLAGILSLATDGKMQRTIDNTTVTTRKPSRYLFFVIFISIAKIVQFKRITKQNDRKSKNVKRYFQAFCFLFHINIVILHQYKLLLYNQAT